MPARGHLLQRVSLIRGRASSAFAVPARSIPGKTLARHDYDATLPRGANVAPVLTYSLHSDWGGSIVPTVAADIVQRTPAELDAFEAILALLCRRTGTDFRCYRSSTLTRRVLNRMISVGVSTFADYLDLLRGNEAETASLVHRVTIKVSRFYRNAEVFDVIRGEVIPELARQSRSGGLRIWSAGCGYGEEPYTLAMLLDEARVPGLVHATDIDRTALAAAPHASYTDSVLSELPAALRERYLRLEKDRSQVIAAIRERVHFAYHDLTAAPLTSPAAFDAPSFDLICCRNVLIYLGQEIQSRILASLIGRIRAGGFLCLGEAEWPPRSLAFGLEPLGRKTRVFRVLETAHAESNLSGVNVK